MAAPALILLGSARSDGYTAEAAARLATALGGHTQLIDLLRLNIEVFRYGRMADDDFPTLVDRCAESGTIVFATPVYWYAMSAVMKNLFDRFSDLLGPGELGRKGRALAGRRVGMLATGTDADAPQGFEVPFERTCAYFDMAWLGGCYLPVQPPRGLGDEAIAAIDRFAARIATDR